MSVTGKRMKERRTQLGISADTLAKYIGVSRSTIFRYENGEIAKIPVSHLANIAELLQTSERFLMGTTNEPDTIVSDNPSFLLNCYEMLNDTGKREAQKRVEELTHIPLYSLNIKAAHNDYAADPDEQKKMREDLANLKKPE